jgi:hypothetical protein
MVTLKSLVSERNYIRSLFVCRSWAKVVEFPFTEAALSRRTLGHRGSEMLDLFHSSEENVLSQILSSAHTRLFLVCVGNCLLW